MSDSVRVEILDGPVASVTIDLPGRRANVLNREVWGDLEAAFVPLRDRSDLRGLLLRSGKPGMFVAGADLKELHGSGEEHFAAVGGMIDHGHRVLALMEELPFPTVALIDGPCLGGGLELALACDERVVSTNERVQIGLPEVKLALIPGWGGTQRLPRLIGREAAWTMLSGGESVSSGELVWGEPVPAERLEAVGRETLAATSFREARERRRQPVPGADFPGGSVLAEVMNVGLTKPLADGIAVEREAFMKLIASPEAQSRIEGFLTKRK